MDITPGALPIATEGRNGSVCNVGEGEASAIVKSVRTQWPQFPKYPNDEDGFQHEERNQTDQRKQLVQDIEANILVWRMKAVIEVAGPAEGGVEGDISRSNEKYKSGSDE